MDKIIIYGFSGSTYVRTALMTCIEKNVMYELTGFEFGSAQHLELHPFMRMPAARIEDIHYYETLAITMLIDELSTTRLQPQCLKEKGFMLQWISASIDYLYPVLVPHLDKQDHVSADTLNETSKVLVLVENQLKQTQHYLAGDELTLADLYVYPMLKFTATIVSDFEALVENLPEIKRWLANIDKRESARLSIPEVQ